MTMYLRRRATFSAGFSHLFSGSVSTGRGHDYLCELTVGGKIDQETGMVINIKDVDAVLRARVIDPLDGKLLDTEMGVFRNLPPTPENITRYIWNECQDGIGKNAQLVRVSLSPTSQLMTSLSILENPDMPPLLTVTRLYDFSASHRLHSKALTDAENAEIFGKCNWVNGHGHNYDVEVTFTGQPDTKSGQLVDLDTLDSLVEEVVLKPYDHKHLNYDTVDFRDLNPTSENLTRVIWNNLQAKLAIMPLGKARLYRIAVRETPRNYFEYYGE